MRVAFYTFGCKLNQFETMAMSESLKGTSCDVVEFEEKAAVYVINTCTVTEKTDTHCRRLIRKTARENPDSAIVVTGCYAQRDPDRLLSLPGVRLVLGNPNKMLLAGKLEDLQTKESVVDPPCGGEDHGGRFPLISSFGDYTRAFIKIQEGCDNRCSYCVVRNVRGPNRSEEEAGVIRQVRKLARAGYREIVLTGIHLGSWGVDTGSPGGLAGLLEKLSDIEGGPKIRLSSIEPNEFGEELIHVISQNPCICRHFHIPLQSGSDRVLERMNRGYTAGEYRGTIEKIARALPGAAIGADVMVGFPGETEEDFQMTLELVDSMPLAYLHVFNYSRRPQTPAATMEGQVSPQVREGRSRRMRSLGNKKSIEYRAPFIGRKLTCLVESRRDRKTGVLRALSDNYLTILVEGPDSLYNNFADVIIDRLEGLRIHGHLKI